MQIAAAGIHPEMAERPEDLARRLDRMDRDRDKDQGAFDTLERAFVDMQTLVRELRYEVNALRQMAEISSRRAEEVAKALDLKEREAAAEAKARTMVARWIQVALGAIVLIVTVWSGKGIVALEQLKALFEK